MGELHNVYQIKPLTINGGAFLKVKEESIISFRNDYDKYKQEFFDDSFPHNTVLFEDSTDLLIFGQNQEDRLIPDQPKGDYLLIQSGSKRGFENNFTNFISEFSNNFDDCLFYVTWDMILQKYQIENGVLLYDKQQNHNNGFVSFIEQEYSSDFQIISDVYLEEIKSAKNIYDSLLRSGENPNDYIDSDDYYQYHEWMKQIKIYNNKYELASWIKNNFK